MPLADAGAVRPGRTRRGAARWDAVVVGLLAAVVCAAGAGRPSLWVDEVATLVAVRRTLPELLGLLGQVDAVHGAYYLLLHAWTSVAGTSPVALRLPSAAACGLVAAGVVVLGRETAGRRVGLAAGAVAVVLPATTWLGVEARPFACATACATWATVVLVRAVAGRGPWWPYPVLVAASGLLFLQSLLVLPAHALTLGLVGAGREVRRAWSLRAVVGAAVVAPVLVAGHLQRAQVAWIDAPTVADLVEVPRRIWFNGPWPLAVVGWALVAVGVVAGVRSRPRRGPGRPPTPVDVALPLVVVPLVTVLVVSLVTPLYLPRYVRWTTAGVALLAGLGLVELARRSPRGAAAPLALLVLATAAAPQYLAQRSAHGKDDADWASAAAVVADAAEPGDAVVFLPGDGEDRSPRRALDGYPEAFAATDDVGLRAPAEPQHRLWAAAWPVEVLPDRLAGAERVWVLTSRLLPDDGERGLAVLASAGWTGEEVWDGPTTVLHLLRAGPAG